MEGFKVTAGRKNAAISAEIERIVLQHDLWLRQYQSIVSRTFGRHKSLDEWSQEELMKVAFNGVKYINAVVAVGDMNKKLNSDYQIPFSVKENGFYLIDALLGIIGRIQLKNLIQIFPVDKEYDGEKWSCKDYFYTMDVLREKGLDNAVGKDNVFDLMWDYQNKDLRELTVFYLSCMNALYRQKTGVDMTEEFCENLGIPSYRCDSKSGVMVNNQTGEILKIQKSSPFTVVK